VSVLTLGACGDASVDTVQVGYRGTALEQNYDRGDLKAKFAQVKLPQSPPPAGESPPGPLPWKNVQVLNDISIAEFNRTMIAMSTWVAGTGNCAYCHNVAAFQDDTLPNGKPLYTKIVARRMLQMTRNINGNYSQHVKNTGVTCYTCHLGKPLPNGLWFYSSQTDYLRHYLDRDGARVITQQVAPSNANRSSVKQTEWTYSLMISQSKSLGVNCTYCHNSRQFASWKEAPPARVTAYHGILMLRDVNQSYLAPLQPVYPAVRLGQLGEQHQTESHHAEISSERGAERRDAGTQHDPEHRKRHAQRWRLDAAYPEHRKRHHRCGRFEHLDEADRQVQMHPVAASERGGKRRANRQQVVHEELRRYQVRVLPAHAAAVHEHERHHRRAQHTETGDSHRIIEFSGNEKGAVHDDKRRTNG
jgi:photosynthetic reaction center cytochrome c subunit